MKARLVGEQDQPPRLDHDRHLGREEVVVAEGDLVGRGRVVLVDHRDDVPGDQPLQRLARVQVVHPLRHVERGQQHLRRPHVVRAASRSS